MYLFLHTYYYISRTSTYLQCFMKCDSNNLLHAVFDHHRCEKVCLSFPLHSNFPHVLLTHHRKVALIMPLKTQLRSVMWPPTIQN